MQEEPLHLVPDRLRSELEEQYGIHIEGDLCPRCRYVLRTEYSGKISEMPVRRLTFSEQEAIGIGYYVATNPNPSDASLLVGSVDTSRLDGDRLDVAGKAFRLDGEFDVANRGLIELVEMFKADRHLLTTLLGLAQEQLIKMERFGSVYADEAIIGHSNEGDFKTFAADEQSEALRDRIIAVQVPYNLRVSEEVKIYGKMLETSDVQDVHVAPLTLLSASTLAVLTRLDPPMRQGMSLIQKLRLYDGQMVSSYGRQDLIEMQRHQPNEGMSGMSPRYVMNRLGAVAAHPGASCISPLAGLDSLWRGLSENVSIDLEYQAKVVGFVQDSVEEYGEAAIRDVQRAYEEEFEKAASMLAGSYLNSVADYCRQVEEGRKEDARRMRMDSSERDMREIERTIGIAERSKTEFRLEINALYAAWKKRGWAFTYKSDSRLRAAVESKLFPSRRELERALTQPRFARQRVEWARRRGVVAGRLVESYGYCNICAEDTISYVTHVLKSQPVLKTPKNEGVDWLWPLHSTATGLDAAASDQD
jgi:serine protein kinase